MENIFKSSITVRYAETDQMGIAHHANYPIWYEEGRTLYIKHYGLTYSKMEEMGILLPLLKLECEYKRALQYEDKATVYTFMSGGSRTKMQFSYILAREGKICATGKSIHGIVDKNLRPFNFEKKFPELYNLLMRVITDEKQAIAQIKKELKTNGE